MTLEKSVQFHEEKHTSKKETDLWQSKLDEAIEDMEAGIGKISYRVGGKTCCSCRNTVEKSPKPGDIFCCL